MTAHHPFIIGLVISAFTGLAQTNTRTITGTVKSFGESFPLEGVSVSVKGTSIASGTQADGIYYITISGEDSVLQFSLPGYQTQEVKITNDSEYNIMLKEANGVSGILLPENDRYFTLLRCCAGIA